MNTSLVYWPTAFCPEGLDMADRPRPLVRPDDVPAKARRQLNAGIRRTAARFSLNEVRVFKPIIDCGINKPRAIRESKHL